MSRRSFQRTGERLFPLRGKRRRRATAQGASGAKGAAAIYPHRKSIERARKFRKNLTPSEARLWTALRQQRLNGLRFRRQHPIGPFIVDFYCPAARLAVEVDGAPHSEEQAQAYDVRRDTYLERVGLSVLRIPAASVRDNLEAVLFEIAGAAGRAGNPAAP